MSISGAYSPLPATAHTPVTPTPTPDISVVRNQISSLHSSLGTPLGTYADRRRFVKVIDGQHSLHPAVKEKKVALSNISPATAEPGASGGCFNSATRFKCIALPSLSQQLTHRGWRNIRIHSQRYIPSMNKQRTLSDSAVKTLKLQQHQQLNLLNRERDMEMAERRCASTHNPHRLTFSFYMGGSSARMFRKGFFLSENKVGQASDFDSPLTPRSNLYYGQGIRGQRPLSNILERRLHQHWREEEQKRIGTASLATTTCNMMDTVEESSLESHHASPTHPLELTGVRAFIGTIRERVFVTES